MATNYNGQLTANEIFAAIFNLVIDQTVFVDNIAHNNSSLVGKAKEDGTLYGNTKLYYSTDVLESYPFPNSRAGITADALNLLVLDYPESPECQSITIDTFRQIRLTLDDYLSKRAWSDKGAFSNFISVMKGWMNDTKEIYEATTYNAYIGTAKSASTINEVKVNLDSTNSGDPLYGKTGEEANRLEAEIIAGDIADLIDDLCDYSRDYNEYGNLRAYPESKIKFVWNKKWRNKITKRDLPTIFHKDGLIDKFTEDSIPARFFGDVLGGTGLTLTDLSAATVTTAKPIKLASGVYTYEPISGNTVVIRSLYETHVTINGQVEHIFPGDELPSGTVLKASGATYGTDINITDTYKENSDIICKVYVKLPPFMSAFSVNTSFFNARVLTETQYLTWGHNALQYLYNYPLISVVKK